MNNSHSSLDFEFPTPICTHIADSIPITVQSILILYSTLTFCYTSLKNYIHLLYTEICSVTAPSLSCVHKHLLSSDCERQSCLLKYFD